MLTVKFVKNALVPLPTFTTIAELADFINRHGIAWVRLEKDGFYTTDDQMTSKPPLDHEIWAEIVAVPDTLLT